MKENTQTQNRKLRIISILTIVIAVIFVLIIAFIIIELSFWPQAREWTHDDIKQFLGVAIPEDATDVRIEGSNDHLVLLDLSFKASPASSSDFARHICDELHQGYDPFNAIDTANRTPNSYVIVLEYGGLPETFYYSSSPNASDTTFGNRCMHRYSLVFNIRVDRSNPVLHQVTFYYAPGLNYTNRHEDELDTRPIPEFPLLVRGLRSNKYGNYVPRELCMDMDPWAFEETGENWAELIGAKVQFTIDGNPLELAYIGNAGILYRRYDDEGHPVDADGRYFTYCYGSRTYWQSQPHEHTMTIEVSTVSGEMYMYSWEFYTDQR